MSDSTWDDYTAEAEPVLEPDLAATLAADVTPVLDAADTDSWQADQATSWGDWHAEIADDAVTDANAELAYAQEAYAGGFDEAGDAAVARADIGFDRAANEDGTAGDYFGTAADEGASADAAYATAVDYAGDDLAAADVSSYDDASSSFDTSSFDTTSYDTTSYDTADSSDAGSYDTGSDDSSL